MKRFPSTRDDDVKIDWAILRAPQFIVCDSCRAGAKGKDKQSLPDEWTQEVGRPSRHYCPKCKVI